MIDPAEANETYRAASAITAFDAIQVAFAALVRKGILSKAEAEQILRQAIETIKTGGVAIKPPNCSPSLWKRFSGLSRHLGSKANEVLSMHRRQVGKEREPLGRGVSSGSFLAPVG